MDKGERLALANQLVQYLEAGDESQADSLLDQMVGARESQLFQEVGKLTRQLHDTMSSFSLDSDIVTMTENDIPDAKERLRYVIAMTEQAANQTLDTVEMILPVSQSLDEQSAELSKKWGRFLDKEMPFSEFKEMSLELTEHFKSSEIATQKIKAGLNEVLLAQGFQDITGQIIKRVIDLVQNLETSMVKLIQLSGSISVHSNQLNEPELPGPAIPGIDNKTDNVAENQDDVDDILSSLGF